MDYTRQSHSVYYTRYHLVISTTYRRKVLNEGVNAYLKLKTLEVMKYCPEIRIIEANTDLDHMHLLLSIPPKMAVSHAVNLIKTNTGRALRLKFQFLEWQGWEDRGQAKLEL